MRVVAGPVGGSHRNGRRFIDRHRFDSFCFGRITAPGREPSFVAVQARKVMPPTVSRSPEGNGAVSTRCPPMNVPLREPKSRTIIWPLSS